MSAEKRFAYATISLHWWRSSSTGSRSVVAVQSLPPTTTFTFLKCDPILFVWLWTSFMWPPGNDTTLVFISFVASISRIIELPINRELSCTFADVLQDFSEAISTAKSLFLVNKVTLSFATWLHLELRSANSCEWLSTSFWTSKVRVSALALVLFMSCAIVLHSWQGHTPAHLSCDSRKHLMWNHFPQMQQRISSPPPRVRWRQPGLHR